MNMNAFSLLTALSSTEAFAKSPAVFPLAQTDHGEMYVSWTDINQMKIMFLSFAVYVLFQVIRGLILIITGSEKKSKEGMEKRLEKLEKNSEEILKQLNDFRIHFAYIKDGQLTADEVRAISRDEINYLGKLRERK